MGRQAPGERIGSEIQATKRGEGSGWELKSLEI